MLGKYKESNKLVEENNLAGSTNQLELKDSDNVSATNKPLIGKLSRQDVANKTEEDEESDEDLSYLL